MGVFGEMCADKYDFSRVDQDGFAIASIERAQRAVHEGEIGADEFISKPFRIAELSQAVAQCMTN